MLVREDIGKNKMAANMGLLRHTLVVLAPAGGVASKFAIVVYLISPLMICFQSLPIEPCIRRSTNAFVSPSL